MTTKWAAEVSPTRVLVEYPRPLMTRSSLSWKNLNGLWQWESAMCSEDGVASPPTPGKALSGSILVPFPVEACLSGIGENHACMHYRLQLGEGELPQAEAGGKTLLHFGAVDWQTEVWMNGMKVGNNTGGYTAFTIDVTAALASKVKFTGLGHNLGQL